MRGAGIIASAAKRDAALRSEAMASDTGSGMGMGMDAARAEAKQNREHELKSKTSVERRFWQGARQRQQHHHQASGAAPGAGKRGQSMSVVKRDTASEATIFLRGTTIFHPGYPGKVAFDLWISILIVYSVIVIPFRIGFEVETVKGGAMDVVDIVMDIFFGIDLFASFNTSVFRKDDGYVRDRWRIAKSYLMGWFSIDFFSTVPIDRIAEAIILGNADPTSLESGSQSEQIRAIKLVRVLRLIRLLKLARVLKLQRLKTYIEELELNPAVIKLLGLLFFIVFIAHLLACFWFMIGVVDINESRENWIRHFGVVDLNLEDQYIAAIYWVIATMMAVGYGDLFAWTFAERIYAIFAQIVGACLFGFILATVTQIVEGDPAQYNLNVKLAELKAYLRHRQIPKGLMRRIVAHFQHVWEVKSSLNELKILGNLPVSLSNKVASYVYKDFINSIPMLTVQQMGFVTEIVRASFPLDVIRGEILITQGLVSSGMFMVSKGLLEASCNLSDSQIGTLASTRRAMLTGAGLDANGSGEALTPVQVDQLWKAVRPKKTRSDSEGSEDSGAVSDGGEQRERHGRRGKHRRVLGLFGKGAHFGDEAIGLQGEIDEFTSTMSSVTIRAAEGSDLMFVASGALENACYLFPSGGRIMLSLQRKRGFSLRRAFACLPPTLEDDVSPFGSAGEEKCDAEKSSGGGDNSNNNNNNNSGVNPLDRVLMYNCDTTTIRAVKSVWTMPLTQAECLAHDSQYGTTDSLASTPKNRRQRTAKVAPSSMATTSTALADGDALAADSNSSGAGGGGGDGGNASAPAASPNVSILQKRAASFTCKRLSAAYIAEMKAGGGRGRAVGRGIKDGGKVAPVSRGGSSPPSVKVERDDGDDSPKKWRRRSDTITKLMRIDRTAEGSSGKFEVAMETHASLWKRRIIHPDNSRKVMWDVSMSVLILYSVIIVPYRISFNVSAEGGGKGFDWFVDCCFLVDMFLSARTAFFDRSERVFVTVPSLIWYNYLQSWFVIDFLSTFPIDTVATLAAGADTEMDGTGSGDSSNADNLRTLKLVRTLRLFRLFKLIRLFKFGKLSASLEDFMQSPAIVSLFMLLFNVIFLAHLIGCFFFYVATQAAEIPFFSLDTWYANMGLHDLDVNEQYLASLYWAFTTMTTVGYGDITPAGRVERIYACFAMLFGATVFGYVIGTIASMVGSFDVGQTRRKEKMDVVKSYMRNRDLPLKLRKEVEDYFDFYLDQKSGFDEETILQGLPDNLRTEMFIYIHGETAAKLDVFRGQDLKFVSTVISRMRPELVTPGEYIYHQGAVPLEMFCIVHGKVELTTTHSADPTDTTTCVVGEGMVFGESSLLLQAPRPHSAQALQHVSLLALSKRAIGKLLESDPEIMEQLQACLMQSLQQDFRTARKMSITKLDLPKDTADTEVKRQLAPLVRKMLFRMSESHRRLDDKVKRQQVMADVVQMMAAQDGGNYPFTKMNEGSTPSAPSSSTSAGGGGGMSIAEKYNQGKLGMSLSERREEAAARQRRNSSRHSIEPHLHASGSQQAMLLPDLSGSAGVNSEERIEALAAHREQELAKAGTAGAEGNAAAVGPGSELGKMVMRSGGTAGVIAGPPAKAN